MPEPEPSSGPASGAERLLPATARGRKFVVAVLALALVLRVIVVMVTRHDYVPLNDAKNFDDIATSLANGHGYGNFPIPPAVGPTSFRAPLYPFALAAVYVVAGDHAWTAGRLVNAALGTLVVAMIGLLAALLWSRRVAAVAMVIAAIHPSLIATGSSLNLEPLLVVVSLGSLCAALQHRRAPRGLLWPVVSGVLLGCAVLTREVGFALILPIAWLVFTAGEPRTRRFARSALAAPVALLLVAAAVVSPWTIRNAVRFHAFEPVSTSAGFGLAGTFNEVSLHDRGQWIPPYEDPHLAAVMTSLHAPDEAELDRVLRTESIDFIKDHPAYVPQVAIWGTVRLFDLDGGTYDRLIAEYVPYPTWLIWMSIFATYVIVLLAIQGMFTAAVRQVPRAVWAIPLLIYLEIAFLLPANVRYRSSLEPFFVLLAAVAVMPIVDRVAARFGWGQAAAAEPQATPAP